MGLLGDLLGDVAGAVGEMGRTYRTAKREEATLTAEQQEALMAMIQRAEAGDVACMAKLAEMYYEGTLLRYDPQEACRWWTEAAKAGDVGSMYNLGLLYMGDISKQFYNNDLAAYWLEEASNRGDQEAWEVLNKNFKYSNLFQKWSRR